MFNLLHGARQVELTFWAHPDGGIHRSFGNPWH